MDLALLIPAVGVPLALFTAYRQFWRPGLLKVIPLEGGIEWARPGGRNSAPIRHEVALPVVVHNVGAHPARLDRVTVPAVEIEGPSQLFEEAVSGKVIRDPEGQARAGLPETISARDKLRILFTFELRGLASRVANTHPTPDLTEYANCLRDLESFSVVVRFDYWRDTRLFPSAAHVDLRQKFDTDASRQLAVDFWQRERPDLADASRRSDR